jgi:uncharacterized protein GlcG (DUF336 family)
MTHAKFFRPVLALGLLSTSSLASAVEVLTVKTIGMELARDIANETVLQCRKMGYQVSAVVVDRSGNLRAALRDDLAARFTLQIAEEKANAVIMSGVSSGEFVKNRSDIRMEMNHVDGISMLEGGLMINAAGNRVGAVGVSGAPGGDLDESCARKALEKYQERLEFAE